MPSFPTLQFRSEMTEAFKKRCHAHNVNDVRNQSLFFKITITTTFSILHPVPPWLTELTENNCYKIKKKKTKQIKKQYYTN